jgi:hypothetical protein
MVIVVLAGRACCSHGGMVRGVYIYIYTRAFVKCMEGAGDGMEKEDLLK